MNDATATSDPGRYADVNGLRLYFEVHGTGAPLVLLHSGVAGLAMLGTILPALAPTVTPFLDGAPGGTGRV